MYKRQVLGRRSTYVSYATILCFLALSIVSMTWIAWTALMLAMLFFFGPHHPRTHDEHMPLDTGRLWLAAFAVVMFVLCFTPAPVTYVELGGPP